MADSKSAAPTWLRAWCMATSLFEIPEIIKVLTGGKLESFQAGLIDTPSVRRLWALMLVLLVISRLSLFRYPSSQSASWSAAAVHLAEAAFFIPEFLQFGHGDGKIAAIIAVNALIFIHNALR